MSDSAPSPAPLDVPRLEALLEAWEAQTRALGYKRDADQAGALRAALSGLVEAGAMLDALEREALREPLLLHDGKVDTRGFRGLGLRPGTMVRSLREAVRPFLSPAAPALREDASE